MNIESVPLYFKSGAETLFGWLHLPPPALRSDVGVVICKPFGYEAVCAHASLRTMADACAGKGATVLRFDYSGTGDSSGGDGTDDEIGRWRKDIRAAVETLRQSHGMRRICLLGVRLGALLAALSVDESGPGAADALIALAPLASGRRYLRELRALQGATNADLPTAAAAANDAAADTGLNRVLSVEALAAREAASAAANDGSLEVTGFTLSAASVNALGAIDLVRAPGGSLPDALILDRSDLPSAKPWADALLGGGTHVRYLALPGFAEMVSTPHASEVPCEMLDAAVEWVDRYRGRGGVAAVPVMPLLPGEPVMELAGGHGLKLIERAVFVDPDRTLFAVVTQASPEASAEGTKASYGVVMLNGGATNHIGPNRMYVDLARRWAARGYVVLRLDLAGLGDSTTRPGQDGNQVYPPHAVDDIAQAIEFLRRRYGVDNITLAGLCAGAYHALRSAIAGLPVNTVLMVNPLTFYWKQGSTLNDLQISEVMRNPGVYAEHVLTGKYWLKLLRGRVNLWRVAMVFLRRAGLAVDSAARDVTRRLHIRMPNDLGWDLQAIAARGVRVVFLFARGDAGAELLKVQGGSAVKAIGDRCRIYTIDGADHIFSQGAARRQLVQLLSSELPR